MSTYVVTGTSRGLGLGLVEVLISMPSDIVKQVFAATRSQEPSDGLQWQISAKVVRSYIFNFDKPSAIVMPIVTVICIVKSLTLDPDVIFWIQCSYRHCRSAMTTLYAF